MFQKYGVNFRATVCVLTLVCLLLVALCGCSAAAEPPVAANTEENSRVYTIDRMLDEQLAQELSNAERVAAFTSARDQWTELAQQYYDALLNSKQEGVARSVEKSQTDWMAYYATALSNEEQVTAAIYGAGSARSGALASYEYELCRSRALELYQWCLQTGLQNQISAP